MHRLSRHGLQAARSRSGDGLAHLLKCRCAHGARAFLPPPAVWLLAWPVQVKQLYYRCDGKKAKEERLGDILTQVPVGQCIVFVHTREAVDTLSKLLTANGHSVSSLHGRMEEKGRDKVHVASSRRDLPRARGVVARRPGSACSACKGRCLPAPAVLSAPA